VVHCFSFLFLLFLLGSKDKKSLNHKPPNFGILFLVVLGPFVKPGHLNKKRKKERKKEET